MVSEPNSAVGTAAHLNQVLELLRKLMEYRSDEVRHRLEKVGRAASMLHMDVLLLIYHFARFSPGNILEIGPYIGGSTIAAALGGRESGTRKKIVTIEAGGTLKHFRRASLGKVNTDFKLSHSPKRSQCLTPLMTRALTSCIFIAPGKSFELRIG